ncbi:MAG: GIY-YIG nuclease family protein [Bacteroidetes bacterium]|nr:GIY-YIG nuclease family protein [Bacteroidota bacterium]
MIRYSTYILLCADDSYYTGMTNNLKRRIIEHSEGVNEGSYTSNRRPVKLVWWQEYIYVDQAIAREKQIKGWSRIKKEALINGISQTLPALSKKKFSIKKKKTP